MDWKGLKDMVQRIVQQAHQTYSHWKCSSERLWKVNSIKLLLTFITN